MRFIRAEHKVSSNNDVIIHPLIRVRKLIYQLLVRNVLNRQVASIGRRVISYRVHSKQLFDSKWQITHSLKLNDAHDDVKGVYRQLRSSQIEYLQDQPKERVEWKPDPPSVIASSGTTNCPSRSSISSKVIARTCTSGGTLYSLTKRSYDWTTIEIAEVRVRAYCFLSSTKRCSFGPLRSGILLTTRRIPLNTYCGD